MPARSTRRMFGATILSLEVGVVLFAALVLYGLRLVDPLTLGIGAAALMLSLVIAAGLQGRPGGAVVGSVLQVPLPLVGVLVGQPMLVAVALIFVVLWVVALRLGARIDREKAEREAQA